MSNFKAVMALAFLFLTSSAVPSIVCEEKVKAGEDQLTVTIVGSSGVLYEGKGKGTAYFRINGNRTATQIKVSSGISKVGLNIFDTKTGGDVFSVKAGRIDQEADMFANESNRKASCRFEDEADTEPEAPEVSSDTDLNAHPSTIDPAFAHGEIIHAAEEIAADLGFRTSYPTSVEIKTLEFTPRLKAKYSLYLVFEGTPWEGKPFNGICKGAVEVSRVHFAKQPAHMTILETKVNHYQIIADMSKFSCKKGKHESGN